MTWSAEYFRRRDLARANREKMWGPFERRASKILERIGWQCPPELEDGSGGAYLTERAFLAGQLLWQMYDALALRTPGEATLETMRARVAALRPLPPSADPDDDIPF